MSKTLIFTNPGGISNHHRFRNILTSSKLSLMKKKLITLAFLTIGIVGLLSAQRSGNYYTDNYYTDNSDYRYQYRYNNSYNDYYGNYRRPNDRRRGSYSNKRMSSKDRKRLSKLQRKYRRTEKCAWENGRLSKSEIRRLDEIQRDIDRIYRKYERNRNNRNRDERRGRRSCP